MFDYNISSVFEGISKTTWLLNACVYLDISSIGACTTYV